MQNLKPRACIRMQNRNRKQHKNTKKRRNRSRVKEKKRMCENEIVAIWFLCCLGRRIIELHFITRKLIRKWFNMIFLLLEFDQRYTSICLYVYDSDFGFFLVCIHIIICVYCN